MFQCDLRVQIPRECAVVRLVVVDVAGILFVLVVCIADKAIAAVVERAEEVSGFMGDGINNVRIRIGRIEHDKSVVVPDPIAEVDRFREPGESSVSVERGRLSHEDGGVRGVFRAFRHETDVLRGELGIERGDDPGDALFGKLGILDLNPVDLQAQIRIAVTRQLAVEVEVDELNRIR